MKQPIIIVKMFLYEYFWGRGSIAFTRFLKGSVTQKRLGTTDLKGKEEEIKVIKL